MSNIGSNRHGTKVMAVRWDGADAGTSLRVPAAAPAAAPASVEVKMARREGRTSIEIVNRIIALENELTLLRDELASRADVARE